MSSRWQVNPLWRLCQCRVANVEIRAFALEQSGGHYKAFSPNVTLLLRDLF
jgi:hypothetical protein